MSPVMQTLVLAVLVTLAVCGGGLLVAVVLTRHDERVERFLEMWVADLDDEDGGNR